MVEDATGKADAGDDVVLVVLGLFYVEEHTRRIELILLKGILWVCHVELAFPSWRVDFHRLGVGVACGELFRQTDAQYAVVEVGGMEAELTVANKYLVDVGQL